MKTNEIERQEQIQKKIKKILHQANQKYQEIYKFKLQIINAYIDSYCIIDEFDYDSKEFDDCLNFLEENLKKNFNYNNIYLEEEVKGRWYIVW